VKARRTQGSGAGAVVLVAGPDGAGKTSVAAALERDPSGTKRIHWRPGLLPHLGNLVGNHVVSGAQQPHGPAPRNRIVSLGRLLYFLVDFQLGYLVRVAPSKRRGNWVVIERGWWDMQIDPRRYRLGSIPTLIRYLGRMVPKPDLLVILDAPSPVLRRRKEELPKDELERQRQAWLALDLPGVQKVVIDATQPLRQVVADVRGSIKKVERRTSSRSRAGWANLPGQRRVRWWLPRGPRRAASQGLLVYEPVTAKARVGWGMARGAASIGGFRLLARGEDPPPEVVARLADKLPVRGTCAVMRANHVGRYIALALDEDGFAEAVAKVATTSEGAEALSREAEAIERLGPLLASPVRPPRILSSEPGLLLLEAISFQPRGRAWYLPIEVARSLGGLAHRGIRHGDAAPWNLLATEDGFVLLDWEAAGPAPSEAWDLCHWLVRTHSLLGRPRLGELLAALRGEGLLGRAVIAYSRSSGFPLGSLPLAMCSYLRDSQNQLDPTQRNGARGLAAWRALWGAMEAHIGSGLERPQGREA
jgi:thymidylate kinase